MLPAAVSVPDASMSPVVVRLSAEIEVAEVAPVTSSSPPTFTSRLNVVSALNVLAALIVCSVEIVTKEDPSRTAPACHTLSSL